MLLPPKKKKPRHEPRNESKKQTEYFEHSDEELEAQEAELDVMYQVYKQHRNIRSKQEEKDIIKSGIGLGSDDEFNEKDKNEKKHNEIEITDKNKNKHVQNEDEGDDEDDDMENDEMLNELNDEDLFEEEIEKEKIEEEIENEKLDKGGGLIVKSDEYIIKEDSKFEKANRWFNDDIFDTIETVMDEDTQLNNEANEENNENNTHDENKNNNNEQKETQKQDNDLNQDTANGTIEVQPKFSYKDLPDVLRLPYRLQRKLAKMNRDYRRRIEFEQAKLIERDCLFEEVPIEKKR